MEEYSAAKTCKGKPELRTSNVNDDYFYSSAEIIIIASRSLLTINNG